MIAKQKTLYYNIKNFGDIILTKKGRNRIMNLKEKIEKSTNFEKQKITIKKLKKQVKGITLIAFVVTIIGLLILAGVALSLTVGDNGLFRRAQNAAGTWQEAREDELRKLTMLEAATNLENQLYKDKNEDTATIPAGFAVSQVESENIIEDGLVVIDKNGNEFVWVPVKNFEEMFWTYDGQ